MRRFVTFEGIDGSGKSTVSKKVYEALTKRGYDVEFTFEPTRGDIGRCIREGMESFDPLTTTFLFMADRIEHVKSIKNWLKDGKIVLCDRYVDSTYAYQSAQLEEVLPEPMEFLKSISERFVLSPDITFLFDIQPEDALERIKDRNRLISFEEKSFLKKVRKNYLDLAKDERFVILDATRSIDYLVKRCVEDILL